MWLMSMAECSHLARFPLGRIFRADWNFSFLIVPPEKSQDKEKFRLVETAFIDVFRNSINILLYKGALNDVVDLQVSCILVTKDFPIETLT